VIVKSNVKRNTNQATKKIHEQIKINKLNSKILVVDKKSNFIDPIHFYSDPIHLKSNPFKIHLIDLDFNLIYILYILWLGYPFYISIFSNMDNQKNSIQNFNIKF